MSVMVFVFYSCTPRGDTYIEYSFDFGKKDRCKEISNSYFLFNNTYISKMYNSDFEEVEIDIDEDGDKDLIILLEPITRVANNYDCNDFFYIDTVFLIIYENVNGDMVFKNKFSNLFCNGLNKNVFYSLELSEENNQQIVLELANRNYSFIYISFYSKMAYVDSVSNKGYFQDDTSILFPNRSMLVQDFNNSCVCNYFGW